MLGANFTVESIMTDLCREIISVSSLVLDLNNHFIDAMFIDLQAQGTALRQECCVPLRDNISPPSGVSRLRRTTTINIQLLTELRIAPL
jgi:hypothetical protein